jgi:hypothetical protein
MSSSQISVFACQAVLDGGKLAKACASVKSLKGKRFLLVQLLCAEDHTTDPPPHTGRFLCLCCASSSLPHVPKDDLIDALALGPNESARFFNRKENVG